MGCGTSVNPKTERNIAVETKLKEMAPEKWDVQMVSQWLTTIKLIHFAKIFQKHSIKGDLLFVLKDEDLSKMGLWKQGDIIRFRKERDLLRLKWQSNCLSTSYTNSTYSYDNKNVKFSSTTISDSLENSTNNANVFEKETNNNQNLVTPHNTISNTNNDSSSPLHSMDSELSKQSRLPSLQIQQFDSNSRSNTTKNTFNTDVDQKTNENGNKKSGNLLVTHRMNMMNENNEENSQNLNNYIVIDNIQDLCGHAEVSEAVQILAPTHNNNKGHTSNVSNENTVKLEKKLNNDNNQYHNIIHSDGKMTKQVTNQSTNQSIKRNVPCDQKQIQNIANNLWRLQHKMKKKKITLEHQEEIGFTGHELEKFIKKQKLIPSFEKKKNFFKFVFEDDIEYDEYIEEICQKLLECGYIKLIAHASNFAAKTFIFINSKETLYKLIHNNGMIAVNNGSQYQIKQHKVSPQSIKMDSVNNNHHSNAQTSHFQSQYPKNTIPTCSHHNCIPNCWNNYNGDNKINI